jgi:hypothetical protein
VDTLLLIDFQHKRTVSLGGNLIITTNQRSHEHHNQSAISSTSQPISVYLNSTTNQRLPQQHNQSAITSTSQPIKSHQIITTNEQSPAYHKQSTVT